MRTPLDALLSAVNRRWPWLVGEQSERATHINHALVTILLFGTIGAGLGSWAGLALVTGLRYGLVVGCAFYVVRELMQRWPDRFAVEWRDGVCDVLGPVWITAPVLWPSHLEAWWALTALYALLVFPFGRRP